MPALLRRADHAVAPRGRRLLGRGLHGLRDAHDRVAHPRPARPGARGRPAARLERVAAARYGDDGYWVDGERRRIPDHWHAHARPAGGFFDPSSDLYDTSFDPRMTPRMLPRCDVPVRRRPSGALRSLDTPLPSRYTSVHGRARPDHRRATTDPLRTTALQLAGADADQPFSVDRTTGDRAPEPQVLDGCVPSVNRKELGCPCTSPGGLASASWRRSPSPSSCSAPARRATATATARVGRGRRLHARREAGHQLRRVQHAARGLRQDHPRVPVPVEGGARRPERDLPGVLRGLHHAGRERRGRLPGRRRGPVARHPTCDQIQDAGLITHDWTDAPDGGMVSTSVVVFDVRPGNPLGSQDWDDLDARRRRGPDARPGAERRRAVEHRVRLGRGAPRLRRRDEGRRGRRHGAAQRVLRQRPDVRQERP